MMQGAAHTVARKRWWHEVTPYQWFMFAVVSAAWLFDNLDQRLFSLARVPALTALMAAGTRPLDIQAFAKTVTALFLMGWGTGGLTIGALGDRFGRARWLTIAVLIYSAGTGLTAISVSTWQFAALRFATGVGIGGVFGLAVAIIAESVSTGARLAMLAVLQVLSTVGNLGAALAKMALDRLAAAGTIEAASSWRWLFVAGALPALAVGLSACYLRESPRWLQLRAAGALPASWYGCYAELLSHREERHHLLVGTLLAVAGVVGLWGIGEYAVDLQHAVFTSYFAALSPGADIVSLVAEATNRAYLLQMIGAAVGMLGFTYIAARFGRRPAFASGFAAAFVLTELTYWRLQTPLDAYWMMPLMGIAQFSVFAGFSIYLPELFAARVRGTGVSVAYNVGLGCGP